MSNVINFSYSDESISFKTRTVKEGPEAELSRVFLSSSIKKLQKSKRHFAIFSEPRIESGFPDIVIASYNPNTYLSWNKERNTLQQTDLKILHHLYNISGGNSSTIERALGVDSKSLLRSLERLLDANLIRWNKGIWIPKSLKSNYGISSLLAVEAKISDTKSVFKQAEINKWFASESYVLLPSAGIRDSSLELSRKRGIGLFTVNRNLNVQKIYSPPKGCIPISYASWQFNEWIGKKICA